MASMEDTKPAIQGGGIRSGRARSEDVEWLSSLSESELDFLISLKLMVINRANNAGVKDLGERFDLRMLRILGCILLEHMKERLHDLSEFPNVLTLLNLCGLGNLNHERIGSTEFAENIKGFASAWEGLCEDEATFIKKPKTAE